VWLVNLLVRSRESCRSPSIMRWARPEPYLCGIYPTSEPCLGQFDGVFIASGLLNSLLAT
jgi:hypothetical protein